MGHQRQYVPVYLLFMRGKKLNKAASRIEFFSVCHGESKQYNLLKMITGINPFLDRIVDSK